ncbi:concanavalin A-like lectin/glucanase domain-containing protein [Globomyces pollinis-pini]|nr:concanavalin A-like lectin/glucanase domain-containing protein [Globomyces pollinis-pini]
MILISLLLQLALAQSTTCNRGGDLLFMSDFSTKVDDYVWWPEYYSTNGERQVYVTNSVTLFAEQGNMILKAYKEKGIWRSARVRTGDGWNNFRAEVTFKLDRESDGAFPAIWMIPEGRNIVWPRDGEIDLMEYSQSFPISPVQQGVQTQLQNSGAGPKWRNCNPNVTDWVTVAVEQTETAVSFFCNGEFNGAYKRPEKYNHNNWPFSANRFHMTINYAIQPNFMRPVPRHINSLSMMVSKVQVTSCFDS